MLATTRGTSKGTPSPTTTQGTLLISTTQGTLSLFTTPFASYYIRDPVGLHQLHPLPASAQEPLSLLLCQGPVQDLLYQGLLHQLLPQILLSYLCLVLMSTTATVISCDNVNENTSNLFSVDYWQVHIVSPVTCL